MRRRIASLCGDSFGRSARDDAVEVHEPVAGGGHSLVRQPQHVGGVAAAVGLVGVRETVRRCRAGPRRRAGRRSRRAAARRRRCGRASAGRAARRRRPAAAARPPRCGASLRRVRCGGWSRAARRPPDCPGESAADYSGLAERADYSETRSRCARQRGRYAGDRGVAANSTATRARLFGAARRAAVRARAPWANACATLTVGVGAVDDFDLDLRQPLQRRAEADVQRRVPLARRRTPPAACRGSTSTPSASRMRTSLLNELVSASPPSRGGSRADVRRSAARSLRARGAGAQKSLPRNVIDRHQRQPQQPRDACTLGEAQPRHSSTQRDRAAQANASRRSRSPECRRRHATRRADDNDRRGDQQRDGQRQTPSGASSAPASAAQRQAAPRSPAARSDAPSGDAHARGAGSQRCDSKRRRPCATRYRATAQRRPCRNT